MGGCIRLQSTPGEGSTFGFDLELPRDGAAPDPAIPRRVQASRGRVLVAVPEGPLAATLREQVQTLGFEPVEASDPADLEAVVAIAVNPAAPCSAVITEAVADGTAQFEEMRSAMQRLAVVDGAPALIGLAPFGGLADSRNDVAFDAVLRKPVHPERLADALQTAQAGSTGASRRVDRPASPDRAERRRSTDDGRPDPAWAALRILVVDDNPCNQKVACLILGKLSCRADVAGDGQEALEMLESLSYDLILMDCQMPRVDGYQATAAIRAREGDDAHVPVVAMTAHAMAGDRERCIEAGMDDYISKPVNQDKLRQIVARWGLPAVVG